MPFAATRMPLVIVPKQWQIDREPPKWTRYLSLPVKMVVIGATRSGDCSNMTSCLREIAKLTSVHQKCTYIDTSDIRYNFLIGGDGRVYEGRGWYNRPTLPTRLGMYNSQTLFIVFMGTYTEKPVPLKMQYVAQDLIMFGVKKHFILPRILEYTIPPCDMSYFIYPFHL